MRNILIGIISGLMLFACGGSSSTTTATGSSSTTTATGGSTTGPQALTVSGATIDLTGTWLSACYTPGAVDQIDKKVFLGMTVTINAQEYTSADGSCTGTMTETSPFVADMVDKGATPTLGWVDGTATATTAPTSKDGAGPLAMNNVTRFTLTVTTAPVGAGIAVGDVVDVGWFIDDTTATTLFYRDHNVTASGITFSIADPQFKQ